MASSARIPLGLLGAIDQVQGARRFITFAYFQGKPKVNLVDGNLVIAYKLEHRRRPAGFLEQAKKRFRAKK